MIQPGVNAFGAPALVRTLLENLLDNAWKFTRKQERARIEFGVVQNSERRTGNSELAYFVRDNGVGFDMAYAQRIFTPFQRLHKLAEFSGNGIGLASVQRIVHRHGGRVWAEAEEGKGATFFFTLGGRP